MKMAFTSQRNQAIPQIFPTDEHKNRKHHHDHSAAEQSKNVLHRLQRQSWRFDDFHRDRPSGSCGPCDRGLQCCPIAGMWRDRMGSQFLADFRHRLRRTVQCVIRRPMKRIQACFDIGFVLWKLIGYITELLGDSPTKRATSGNR